MSVYTIKNMDSINESIKKYSEDLGIEFIDVTDFLCNDKKQICNMFDKEDNLLYRDSFHFTINEATSFAKDFYDKFLQKDVDLILEGSKNE